jgi:hypothetical protein
MKSKWIVLVVLLVAVFIGTQYKSDDLTCNLFANPPTFRDKEGRLITGHTIRLHPNGEIYSKAQMKDGVMHGPFISFWDNGQVQMSLVWDGGIRYKKMRSWDRDGKRLRGSGDEQMQQIRELDSVLNSQFETLELDKIIF